MFPDNVLDDADQVRGVQNVCQGYVICLDDLAIGIASVNVVLVVLPPSTVGRTPDSGLSRAVSTGDLA